MADPKLNVMSNEMNEKIETDDMDSKDERIVVSAQEERRLRRKFDFYLLPPLTFMCVAS